MKNSRIISLTSCCGCQAERLCCCLRGLENKFPSQSRPLIPQNSGHLTWLCSPSVLLDRRAAATTFPTTEQFHVFVKSLLLSRDNVNWELQFLIRKILPFKFFQFLTDCHCWLAKTLNSLATESTVGRLFALAGLCAVIIVPCCVVRDPYCWDMSDSQSHQRELPVKLVSSLKLTL